MSLRPNGHSTALGRRIYCGQFGRLVNPSACTWPVAGSCLWLLHRVARGINFPLSVENLSDPDLVTAPRTAVDGDLALLSRAVEQNYVAAGVSAVEGITHEDEAVIEAVLKHAALAGGWCLPLEITRHMARVRFKHIPIISPPGLKLRSESPCALCCIRVGAGVQRVKRAAWAAWRVVVRVVRRFWRAPPTPTICQGCRWRRSLLLNAEGGEWHRHRRPDLISSESEGTGGAWK